MSEFYECLAEILEIEVDQVTPDLALDEGGWDSLAVVSTIALIDVDDFKRINEEHGHSIGDEVLCSVVEVLHRCAAPANTVARYGGEEFALLFPGLSTEEAERSIVAMQRAITFSAGVARIEPSEPLSKVMARADRALRHAKLSGKNCIVVADQTAPIA